LRTRLITLGALAAVFLVAAPLGSTAVGTDSTALRTAVTVPAMQAHLNAFQGFANASGGTRVDGTSGFENPDRPDVEDLRRGHRLRHDGLLGQR